MSPDVSFLQGLLQNGLLLAAIAWLLKMLVSDKLRTISDDIKSLKRSKEEISGEIRTLDVRVSRVEERCGITNSETWPGFNRRCDTRTTEAP